MFCCLKISGPLRTKSTQAVAGAVDAAAPSSKLRIEAKGRAAQWLRPTPVWLMENSSAKSSSLTELLNQSNYDGRIETDGLMS